MASTRKKRVRFTMDVNLTSDVEKDAFCRRLSAVRDQLTPVGSLKLNNYELLLALFDLADRHTSQSTVRQQTDHTPSTGCFMKNSGFVTHESEVCEGDQPRAAEEYEKKLRSTLIFRNAESFCRCRDTFWVESFNHQLLTYLPKRIHFGSTTFRMRMFLAVMDWNENSQRAYTSERMVLDMRRPDRRTPMKARVKKTYAFADTIWKAFVGKNVHDMRPVDDENEAQVGDSDDEDDDDDDQLRLDGEYYDSDDVMDEDVESDDDACGRSQVGDSDDHEDEDDNEDNDLSLDGEYYDKQ